MRRKHKIMSPKGPVGTLGGVHMLLHRAAGEYLRAGGEAPREKGSLSVALGGDHVQGVLQRAGIACGDLKAETMNLEDAFIGLT